MLSAPLPVENVENRQSRLTAAAAESNGIGVRGLSRRQLCRVDRVPPSAFSRSPKWLLPSFVQAHRSRSPCRRTRSKSAEEGLLVFLPLVEQSLADFHGVVPPSEAFRRRQSSGGQRKAVAGRVSLARFPDRCRAIRRANRCFLESASPLCKS